MKNASLAIGFVAGLTVGIILTQYARADSANPCSAGTQAYQTAFTHYRPKILKPTDALIYPHELDGMTAANLVSETYGVSCFVKPGRNP